MRRREFNHATWLCGLGVAWWVNKAQALGLGDLSSTEALGGVRAALSQGAKAAVLQLGQAGGFLNNPKVRIGLPGILEDAAPVLKATGQGKRLDALVQTMNEAAEKAVPLAADLLAQAIQHLSVEDARRILGGGDTSVQGFACRQAPHLAHHAIPPCGQAQPRPGSARRQVPGRGRAGGQAGADEGRGRRFARLCDGPRADRALSRDW